MTRRAAPTARFSLAATLLLVALFAMAGCRTPLGKFGRGGAAASAPTRLALAGSIHAPSTPNISAEHLFDAVAGIAR
jgi:hypothetical protein